MGEGGWVGAGLGSGIRTKTDIPAWCNTMVQLLHKNMYCFLAKRVHVHCCVCMHVCVHGMVRFGCSGGSHCACVVCFNVNVCDMTQHCQTGTRTYTHVRTHARTAIPKSTCQQGWCASKRHLRSHACMPLAPTTDTICTTAPCQKHGALNREREAPLVQ